MGNALYKTYLNKKIKLPSMIAAIIKRGITMKKNTLKEFPK